MATAKVLGQTLKVLQNLDDYYSQGTVTPYLSANSLNVDTETEGSLFHVDQDDADKKFFSLLKKVYKDAEELVVKVECADDADDNPLVDVTKTEILFNADGTYSVYNPDFERLAKDELAEISFSYRVDNGDETVEKIVIREVTMEIIGTNEAPIVVEHADIGVSEDIFYEGQVIATDIDSDDDSTTLTYIVVYDPILDENDNPVLDENNNPILAENNIPGFNFYPDGRYSIDTNALYQHLSEGEVIEYSFGWKAEDTHSVSSEVDKVKITITGTNDAPVVIAHADIGVDEGESTSGRVIATDVDNDNDGLSVADGDNEDLAYILTDGENIPGFIFNQDGTYSIDASIDAYQYLAKDETVEYTFKWQAKDRHDALSSEDSVKITITGTNDAPVVEYNDLSASFTESDTPVGFLSDTGTIAFSDANIDDIHTIASVTTSDDVLGTLSAIVSTNTTNGIGGVITWEYNIAASDVEYLAKDVNKIENFTITLDDGNGGLVDRIVKVTITGTNDAPIIVSHDDQIVMEDAFFKSQVVATDIDSDNLTYILVDGSDIPGFTFSDDGSYSIDTSIDAYQYLAKGETVDYNFSWKAKDIHGIQSDVDDVKITVTGTNDIPTVTSELTSYTFNLLEGASDVDTGAVLSIRNLIESEAKTGWSLQGTNLAIDSTLYQNLYENDETETFSFSYEIVDEHGAMVEQTLNFTIEGKALPTLTVSTSAGLDANIVLLEITATPYDTEQLFLSFASLPTGATVLDNSNPTNDVTTGIANFSGTQTFQLILQEDEDFDDSFSVNIISTTGAQNTQYVDLAYDIAFSEEQLVEFYSNNQNMWAEFDAYIGWHKYIPILGDAPIIWNEEDQVWEDNEAAEYWRTGDFNVVDVDISLDKIYDALLWLPQQAVDLAILAKEAAAGWLQSANDWLTDATNKLAHVTDVSLAWADYWIADKALTVAQGAYDIGTGVFNIADDVFDVAEDAFEWLESAYSSAYTTWYNSNKAYLDSAYKPWWSPITLYDPIKAAKAAADWLTKGAAWTALEVGKPIYNAAVSVFDDAKDAYATLGDKLDDAEIAVQNKYTYATNLESDMHADSYYTDRSFDDGDAVHAGDVTLAAGEVTAAGADVVLAEAAVFAADGGVFLAETNYTIAHGLLNTAIDASGLDFSAKLKIDTDIFAQVGLKVDFELDLGSVDTDVDYQLTSLTQYNQTTDMLAITPMMTNMTDYMRDEFGEIIIDEDTNEPINAVAFNTISPNATFYAALLYDVGADVSMFFDGDLSGWYFDFDNLDANGLPTLTKGEIFDIEPTSFDFTLGTNTWNDMLTSIPGYGTDSYETALLDTPEAERPAGFIDDLGVGELVLIDFDSTEGGPYEVPFIEQLTENIVSIELDLPVIETEGTQAEFSNDYYDEGDFVNFDITELTDIIFDLTTAKLDLSPEYQERYNIEGLADGTTLDEAVASIITGLINQFWDIIDDGQSEGIPTFILDMNDETSTSLLHFNIWDFNTDKFLANPFESYDYKDDINEDTGSLGFYTAYGESDPIIKVNIDIDAAVALIANEVIKAIAIAASAGSATAIKAVPTINPLNLEFGIEQVLKMAKVPDEQAKQVTDYVTLGVGFEAADLDVYAQADFSQEFTLSMDDMAYTITMEDEIIYKFAANGGEVTWKDSTMEEFTHYGINTGPDLIIADASKHDANGDGVLDYSLSIVPDAMFSNDTEIGLSVGYVLDFLKAEFKAGLKLPLDQLFGIDPKIGDDGKEEDSKWPDIELNAIDIAVGPLLRLQGDLDIVDFDVYESRFDMDVGSVEDVELTAIGINDQTMFDGVA